MASSNLPTPLIPVEGYYVDEPGTATSLGMLVNILMHPLFILLILVVGGVFLGMRLAAKKQLSKARVLCALFGTLILLVASLFCAFTFDDASITADTIFLIGLVPTLLLPYLLSGGNKTTAKSLYKAAGIGMLLFVAFFAYTVARTY